MKSPAVETAAYSTNQNPALITPSEKDYVSMLMASPIFQQISELQEMLDKQTGVSLHVTGKGNELPIMCDLPYRRGVGNRIKTCQPNLMC